MFMAFKMSGFLGLMVVEEVTPCENPLYFLHKPADGNDLYSIRTHANGNVYATKEEAEQERREANKDNPFRSWKSAIATNQKEKRNVDS